MGGLLIAARGVIPFLLLSHYTLPGADRRSSSTLGCGAIGFLDDFIKLRTSARSGSPAAGSCSCSARSPSSSATRAPRGPRARASTSRRSDGRHRGRFWYVLLFLVVAGAANGVNLTDGIDGLAAGTGIIALITYTAICIFTFIRLRQVDQPNLVVPRHGHPRRRRSSAARSASSGSTPSRRTCSWATRARWRSAARSPAFAVMTKTEVLLLLIGGIFLIEALSVILQVISFKYWGRRIFLMAPIHHHFEMKAWSETKIMVRFWILGGDPLRVRVRRCTSSTSSTSRGPLMLPRRALIVGLARSGQAAALALAERGVEVVGVDRNPDVDAGRLAAAGVEVRLGTDEGATGDVNS